MQTSIDLPEDQLTQLDVISAAESTTRSEILQRALSAYLAEHPVTRPAEPWSGLDAAFGHWKDRKEDAITYLDRLRAEWDREWDR